MSDKDEECTCAEYGRSYVHMAHCKFTGPIADYHSAKHDAGKPRVGLMMTDFSNALRLVAEVSTFGAQKYAPSSWRTVPDAEDRYWDAVGRHLLGAQGMDEESGLPHLAHAAWGLLALLELRTGK